MAKRPADVIASRTEKKRMVSDKKYKNTTEKKHTFSP